MSRKEKYVKRLNDKKQVFEDKIKILRIELKIQICCICYDETTENKSLVKCCSNTFCFECINLWLAKITHVLYVKKN